MPNPEASRLEILRRHQILDTAPEAAFDQLTRLAARICTVPISLINLIDQERQWLKSMVGWEQPETSYEIAFCAQTILQSEPFVVPDTLADQRFATNLLVTEAPHIRFYAGVPLVSPEGDALGTLCVMDVVPRELSLEQLESLQDLGQQVITQLELRRQLINQAQTPADQQHKLAEGKQAQQERLMAEISQRIRQSLDLDHILSTTVSEVRQFLQVDRVFIYHFEPDWGGVVVVESVASEWPSMLGARLKDPTFANEFVLPYQQGRIQVTDDIYAAGGLTQCYIDFLAQSQVQAVQVVPIVQAEKLWGLLAVNQCSAPRQWQPSETRFLQHLASQVAIAIHQSELYQQAQIELAERERVQAQLKVRVDQQVAVTQLGQMALANADLSSLMATAVTLVADQLQVAYSKVLELLPEEDSLLLRAGVGWQSGLVDHQTIPLAAESQAGLTLRSDQPVIVEDLRTETRFPSPSLLHDHQIISGLSVIIQGQNHPFGVLAVHSTEQRQFTADDIHFLQAVSQVLATAIDRHQAEQKIQEQAALLDIATDAIAVRDLDHKILFWSQGAEQIYGWQAAEILGQHADQILFKESPPLTEIHTALYKTGEWQGELRKLTKSGQELVVESRWTLVQDQDGPKSILTVDTDITEKKKLETQFLRAQRMESIGTLASGIAHDLNNVLAPILMAVQLLEKKLPDQKSQQLLQTLELNAKRGADLIKQVLSFARGLEGKRTILQVRHLIQEIKKIVEQTFPKSIQVYTNLPTDLWTISGDITQLHQVLMNLCVNAHDAMPEGGILTISAENRTIDSTYARLNLEAQVGSFIVITVTDTGTGIAAQVLDRIFEPFFTTKELGQGTGLGLSTVIGIVKSHGGFVKVYSEVGKGTRFRVYLPAVRAIETPAEEESELAPGHGELILVVDDEVTIREVTQTLLEAHDYRVLTARDGVEAIGLYAQHQAEISLALIDMMMPSMDGPMTIRTLQAVNPQLKIIVISGLAPKNKLAEAASMGTKAFLSKPYTGKELLNTLETVLSEP